MTLTELLLDEAERQHCVSIARDIMRHQDATVAEDVVSRVYENMVKHPKEARNPLHFLRRAIKWQCWVTLKQKKAESEVIEFRPSQNLPDIPVRPEGEVRLIQRDVQKALLQLSPSERYVAEQLLMGSCPGDQIEVCRELGMKHGLAKWKRVRVRTGRSFDRLVSQTKAKLRVLLADYRPV